MPLVLRRISKVMIPGRDILRELRSYLDHNEPRVARWLYNTWNAEAAAIKYQELHQWIMTGQLSIEALKAWQEEYSGMIVAHFTPIWLAAIEAANEKREKALAPWHFDPASPAVTDWVSKHGSELAVNLSETQHQALMGVIQRSASLGEFGPDELSRFMRPIIGMVPREANAATNYYEWLLKNGVAPKKAMKKYLNYAGRIHRHRAFRIARTELAFAYNAGNHMGAKQAQAAGYLPPKMDKVWCTADDERVCDQCGGLDGTTIGIDEDFPSVGRKTAPAHPHCRCAVAYVEHKA